MASAKQSINCKDLILMLLYVKGYEGANLEPIRGRTRMVKMVFLFEKEVWPSFRFKSVMPASDLPLFEALHFGPFSSVVYADLDFLTGLGFVRTSQDTSGQNSEEEALEYQWWLSDWLTGEETSELYECVAFALTDLGKRFVEQRLLERLDPQQIRALEQLKARCTGITLRELLKYTYSRYPEYTIKSRIRDSIIDA